MEQERVRIISDSDPAGSVAACLLFFSYSYADKKCAIRIIDNYCDSELRQFSVEEYSKTIFVGKDITACEAYLLAKKLYPGITSHSYILVAGYLASHLEFGESLSVPDVVLQDSLQSLKLYAPKKVEFEPVTCDFVRTLMIKGEGMLKGITDFSAMLVASMRNRSMLKTVNSLMSGERESIIKLLSKHTAEIESALSFVKENPDKVEKRQGLMLVNFGDYLNSSLTGSVAASIAHNGNLASNHFVLVMCYTPKGEVKASLRFTSQNCTINLNSVLKDLLSGIPAEFGGRTLAAGCVFAKSHEKSFVENAIKLLPRLHLEEQV